MARTRKKSTAGGPTKCNQNLPVVPLHLIEDKIQHYHSLRISYRKMLQLLRDGDFDTGTYGLGLSKLKEYAKQLDLTSTRSQAHTFTTIEKPVAELRKKFPQAGLRMMREHLKTHFKMRVPKELLRQYFLATEPEKVVARKAHRIRRKVFYAAGVNHIWAMDQHDKWKRFGLRLHLGVEVFVGKLLWLRVWWNNSNPKHVCKLYLDSVRRYGLPLITQSDPGTENYNIAYAQCAMRQHLDPSLEGSIQHKWMRGHGNIKPEQSWSRLRATWSPGFENMLEKGVRAQWYNPDNIVDNFVFRWVAIPWLQTEADTYLYSHNTTMRRKNKNKVLPHGIPDIMFDKPHTVDAVDFRVLVPSNIIDAAETKWAPSEDPIFQLVPPAFEELIIMAYQSIGEPAVKFETFWNVYKSLRDEVLVTPFSEDVNNEMESERTAAEAEREAEENNPVKPPPPFADLPVRAGNFDIGDLDGFESSGRDSADESDHDSDTGSEHDSDFIVEFTDTRDEENLGF